MRAIPAGGMGMGGGPYLWGNDIYIKKIDVFLIIKYILKSQSVNIKFPGTLIFS